MGEPTTALSDGLPEHPRPRMTDRDALWHSYVQRAAAGDQQAFAALYDETSNLVYSVALRILGNEADAEEVALDVYAQVWRTAAKFSNERGSVNAWLIMLARSRAIDRFRSRSRSRSEEPVDALMELAGGGPDPEQVSLLTENRDRIRAALQSISPEQRQAIELAFFSGYTQSELAEHLGQPLGTVKTRIRLGMMKLKDQLGGASYATS
jgi:RNA polymerase sigma-70 factor (ECF subfamily)